MLVSNGTVDGNSLEEVQTGVLDAAVVSKVGNDSRNHVLLQLKELQKLLAVLEGLQLHEIHPGGVRGVSAEHLPTGQLPDHEGVHISEHDSAGLMRFLDSFHIFEEPPNLEGTEVSVDGKTGHRLVFLLVALKLLEDLFYDFCGTGITPDNGVVKELTGLSVPGESGFSLVGDADLLDG